MQEVDQLVTFLTQINCFGFKNFALVTQSDLMTRHY